MIKVSIRVRGALKKPFGKTEFEYACKSEITLKELLKELEYKDEYLQAIMVSVNNDLKDQKYRVQDNDEIMLFVNVGGG